MVPITGPLVAAKGCQKYWGSQLLNKCVVPKNITRCGKLTEIPDKDFGPMIIYPNGAREPAVILPGGEGYFNTDLLIYVNSINDLQCGGKNVGESGTIAFANSCQYDQYDRTTIGTINFCPNIITPDPQLFDKYLAVALHELTQ